MKINASSAFMLYFSLRNKAGSIILITGETRLSDAIARYAILVQISFELLSHYSFNLRCRSE